MADTSGQAKLVSRHAYPVPGKILIEELFFDVPLDHSSPSHRTIRIFARSATRYSLPIHPLSSPESIKASQKPWLLWLQGGPGGACPTPQSQACTHIFLDHGYQVLHVDQRGTGLSTPVTAATLALQGDVQQQADYLKLFRADSIVRDAEAIRKVLTAEYPEELKRWTIYGQSFGGFCAFTYLSFHPEGVQDAFVSGGVPPIGKSVDEVYSKLFIQAKKRNKAYYTKFPMDVKRVYKLVEHFDSKGGLPMPSGGVMTGKRFLLLGMNFGSKGGIQSVHDLVLKMSSELEHFGFITRPSLSSFEGSTNFDDNAIYAILREAIYCDGKSSNWAAERMSSSFPEFSLGNKTASKDQPLYLPGGMVFPFMFDVCPELQQLKDVAHLLATFENWPKLYDEEQLKRNKVPLYVASFVDDAYVDFKFVQETLEGVGKDTKEVLEKMFGLRDDVMD
ncbi:related to proline iminopeptidase [Phialocephala subalpina]|uniref:Related to proline iminopeptidase n=1 Tax=Phialocephala subalpina TaxID=576137 RepID=A0A1L7XLV2_9HELO|nr:related to proline iminopeptidase [Phialocephala subalpina]